MEAEQPDSAPVRALCQLSETYGRALCREPQRVEAMLRDLCPGNKREIFLLVSALKEQIVLDLMSTQDGLPEEIVVSRSRRKLADNLGFTEESASWAVDSWLQASRILAATPDIPLPIYEPSQSEELSVSGGAQTGLDWVWLALCLGAILSSALAILTGAWFALHHDASTFQAWLTDTGLFTAGLAISGLALFLIARQFQKRRIPNHWIADANLGALAMLIEVTTMLVLPLAPVVTVALWAGEWALGWHITGQPHDLSFHLGRILQSLLFAVFLWRWILATVSIQGRLGSSAIGRRGR
jgi:hypothetical protein